MFYLKILQLFSYTISTIEANSFRELSCWGPSINTAAILSSVSSALSRGDDEADSVA